ncbi:MAG: SUMF1/EgtB/PvdO family nonheme iron enzyme [Candidatus Brocadiae bacterium]|nr:SUMF1/EgtB/PvdO family nonheme iron enzyme [Candidatus Brocadiia bacterium]
MKGILSLFSWVASGLVEGLCPGGIFADTLLEELNRYRESALLIGEKMQAAWTESLRTLEAALGGGGWLMPKSRKQFAEKFFKDVIVPFATKNNITGPKLEAYLKKSLEQCRQIISMGEEIINFQQFDEKTLFDALSGGTSDGMNGEDMNVFIIDRIQTHLPHAKELLELLWHRNLILEGLVAHFNFIISHNSPLANVVSRMDQQRIQRELGTLQEQMQKALKSKNLAEIGKYGSRITQLTATEDVYKIQNEYMKVFSPFFDRLDKLDADHQEINGKLDKALEMLSEIQKMQESRTSNSRIRLEAPLLKPSIKEITLVEQFKETIKTIGWERIPEHQRAIAANSVASSMYSSEKISQALSVLEDAIRNDVHSPDLYFNYFQALQAAKRSHEAVEIYNKAVKMNPELALFPPEKYKMTGIIGHGGMGIVYKANWIEKNLPVAIKVLLLPEEWYPGARERFLQAARSATALKHPNIVCVHGIHNEHTDYPCMVMEYLDGIDLHKKIKKDGPFSFVEGIQVARSIAQGLLYAHEKKIIHRDLKPGNIVLTSKGAVIIDFGLAKWEKDSTLTLAGEIFYTLYYSSPEQKNNFHNVDNRSDIYSFGKTLYYLFTGDEPYDIDWEDVPELIRPILKKSTQKDPENRYKNIEEMLFALEKAMEGELVDVTANEDETSEIEYIRPAQPSDSNSTNKPPQEIVQMLEKECHLNEQGMIVSERDCSCMVYVPAGTFLMGDESDRSDYDEAPLHEVYLDAYFIDMYPVTNKMYALFLKEIAELERHPSPWCHPNEPDSKVHFPQFWYNSRWNQPDHPVVGVDWWDAYAYSRWAGKDLPTEAEWEKAARGVDGRIYPWGNELPTPEICNFNRVYQRTTPVGKFPCNVSPYGCRDMAGNVWEWCFDWFDPTYYKKSPFENPRGPSFGRTRVGRGGSWFNDALKIRTSSRAYGKSQSDRNCRLGFRTVKRIYSSGQINGLF